MNLMRWLTGEPKLQAAPGAGHRRTSNPGDPNGALRGVQPPPRNGNVRTVSPGKAYGLSDVYRAIGIHVVSAKQIGLDVYRRDATTGDETQILDPNIIRRPNPFASRSTFIEQTVSSLASTGNAYWRKITNDAGEVSSLDVLNPLDVVIDADRNGLVNKYAYRQQEFRPSQIQHLSLLRVPGSPYGLGPIQAAQVDLSGALDLRDHANSFFFGPSGQPSGILKSDSPINADQAQAAKDRWEESQGGTRGVAVLGQGLTYTPVLVSPKDAQYIESREFATTQIARLFGVPASLMLAAVEGNSQTYSNVEQDWLGYVRFSLMQYLIEIEDAFTDLLPRGQRARFNVDALLRADTTTRYQAHKIALEAGFMTKAEVRHLEKLPQMPEQELQP